MKLEFIFLVGTSYSDEVYPQTQLLNVGQVEGSGIRLGRKRRESMVYLRWRDLTCEFWGGAVESSEPTNYKFKTLASYYGSVILYSNQQLCYLGHQ